MYKNPNICRIIQARLMQEKQLGVGGQLSHSKTAGKLKMGPDLTRAKHTFDGAVNKALTFL